MLFSIKKEEWLGNTKNDLFGGLVTAVALIPEVIGFAIIAGVNPIAALFASVTTAIVTSITGGRPAMTSAAAGSMALVMVVLIKNHGLEYMIAATILTGLLQLLFGYIGIHKLMKFISKPVMMGFVNALAVLIFISQVQQLGHVNKMTLVIVGATIAMMYLIPRVSRVIPPALIIIVVMTLVALLPQLGLQKVGDLGDMTGAIGLLQLPAIPFTFETLLIILPTAIALSLVGIMESLLTLPLIDNMTKSTGDSRREVKSQGLANVVTGFFGGQAGCAMIGQAVINVKSGGRQRLSTFIAGVTLLLLIVFLKDVMVQIPTAALIGIMMVVALETFNWDSLRSIKRIPVADTVVMAVTVAIVVYTHNLAIGILIGVVLSMIIFIAKLATLTIERTDNVITVRGVLFFASAQSLVNYFEKTPLTANLILDVSGLSIRDASAHEALATVINRYQAAGLPLTVRDLSAEKSTYLG
ncbi:SulP family inorganic anion transporter [Brochothrix campestris]|uniref:Antisigma-factor antagonist, STAS n=1 Tax=Brochothrix campestris FSL F6-1037 TaxID=1265861 RepID=W7CUA1_9LIST|nr:SulP family inorganic anion transporter [Brochothrix campestris]EUJ39396.1 antisigma-factor antagonist, STAS [Brochothrix campestris FSL F6-1037]